MRCSIESFQTIIHIIILSETWIKTEDEARRIQIPCYTHYYNFRQDKRGGGVSVFVHNNLKHSIIEDHCIDDNHYLWVHVSKFSLDVGAIYKPERTNDNNFLETYSSQLQKMKRAVVFGDFNYNLLDVERGTRNYKDILKENDFKILNKIDHQHCTRETTTTKTILDHVCSNLKHNDFHLAIIDSAISDHKQIFCEIKRYQPPPLRKVEYSAVNYEKFYKLIENIRNPEEDFEYSMLEKQLIDCLSKSKIIKNKILNLPKQDWINKNIIEDINNRNILWQNYKRDKTDKNIEEELNSIKTKVRENIETTKNAYYYKSFINCMNKPRKMWQLIFDLSKNKLNVSPSVDKLITDSGAITDEKEICEYFNSYFSTIGSVLANAIPKKYHQSQVQTQSFPTYGTIQLNKMSPITPAEIVKIIDNLDNNTSSGIDGINTKAVKCIKNIVADKLTSCLNRCLNEGTFPDSLKVAKVTPIYKSGSKSNPSNYRPISVLPVISKILEKVIYSRLESHLNSIDFFYKQQYGFRRHSNTLSATIDLITKIKNKIDKKQVGLGIFIDLTKAFDTVSHEILLRKISNIGVTGNAFKILKSYLYKRKQIVRIGQHQSSPKSIQYGVPQGSILGPLLFLIYINDISQIGLHGDISLYADDTSLFYFGSSINIILPKVRNDLKTLSDWFLNNLLTINISKTNYVIFSAKNKNIDSNFQLMINDEIIERKTHEKYLGLSLDNHLNWKPHLQKIKSKLISLTGAIRNITKCLPRKVKYIIYNSLIKPHIDYLIEIWGTAAKSNLNIIQRSQNRLIKILFNYRFRTSTQKIYTDTKIMNIKQTYKYYTCILVRKILNRDIHTKITFTKKLQVQKIKLRNANNLILRPSRTNYGKKNIEYEGAQLYNSLPKEIKETKSMLSFKKLLKFYILKQKI